MGLQGNNSSYARGLLMIAEAVFAGIFIVCFISYLILLFMGRCSEAKCKARDHRTHLCIAGDRAKVLFGLLIIMSLSQILVWSLLSAFDVIHVALAAVLCVVFGGVLLLLANLLLKNILSGTHSYIDVRTPCVEGTSSNTSATSDGGGGFPEKDGALMPIEMRSAATFDHSSHHQRQVGGGASNKNYAVVGADDKNHDDNNNQQHIHQHNNNRTFVEDARQFAVDVLTASVEREGRFRYGIALAVYIVIAGVIILVLQGVCYCSNPTIITTWITRKSETRICQDDQFCHLYPLLGVNSSRMRLVGHVVTSDGESPRNTYANICPITRVGATYTNSDPCTIPQWTVQGKVLDHSHIGEDRRFISHVVLINLLPRTYYRATVFFTLSSGAQTSRSVMFRTISAPDDMNATVRFISGGDFYSGQSGKDGMREALALEPNPDFIQIGGDISYSNNIRYCYLRVDYPLEVFANLRTSMGTAIPFIYLIGNHESGGYQTDGFDKLFFHQEYFANFDSDEDPPGLAQTYHKHILSGTVGLVSLDSDLMIPIEDQNEYLKDSLAYVYDGWRPASLTTYDITDLPPESARLAMVSYHNPAYPSLREFSTTQSARVRQHWCPILDAYKVPVVFEFHDHAFKRSYPILGNRLQQPGKGTVYIGDGGLGLDRDVSKDDADNSYLQVKFLQHNIQIVTITPDKKVSVRTYGDNYEHLDDVTISRIG